MTVLSFRGGSPTAVRPFRCLHSHEKSQSVCGQRNKCHLRALLALFGLVAFFDGTAPRIRKSSADLPPLIAAVNHFGLNPRPAQVSSGFCGVRYFGGTGPLSPNPEAAFRCVLAPCNRLSFASSGSSGRRCSVTLLSSAPST